MVFELKLAWRYFRTGRSRLVRFTSLVAIAGIAVGLATFIIAQSLSQGFADGIKEKVLSNTGHIIVSDLGVQSTDAQLVSAKIRLDKDVTSVAATTFEPAALMADGVLHYAVLRAVADETPGFRGTGQNVDGEEHRLPLLAGKRLVMDTREDRRGEALLVFSGADGGSSQVDVKITGTFETGLFEYDSTWVRIRQGDFARLKGTDRFRPTAFTVFVRDPFVSDRTAERLRKTLGSGYQVVDWQEANKPLFSALALERKIALWIIALIVIVALLNITTTLSLLVKERLPDIAILRTCGANTKKLAAVFLLEGWILSLIGITLGVGAGVVFSLIANRFRLISLPGEVYSLNSIRLVVDPFSVMVAAILTFLLCTAAMAIPVLRAAQAKPLDNLRLR
jgi:lipoprotein-releasing system permease protein